MAMAASPSVIRVITTRGSSSDEAEEAICETDWRAPQRLIRSHSEHRPKRREAHEGRARHGPAMDRRTGWEAYEYNSLTLERCQEANRSFERLFADSGSDRDFHRSGRLSREPHPRANDSMGAERRVLPPLPWQRLDSDDWELYEMRPRVSSMPLHGKAQTAPSTPNHSKKSPGPSSSYYCGSTSAASAAGSSTGLSSCVDPHKLIRSYTITRKGLVKKEEQRVVSRSSSVASSFASSTTISAGDSASCLCEDPQGPRFTGFQVYLLGQEGVGKRSLIQEFLDPDYVESTNISFGKLNSSLSFKNIFED